MAEKSINMQQTEKKEAREMAEGENMNRVEYMQRLAEGLKEYDEEFAMDILEDYKRHFDEAAQDGRSEESVCDELGSPEDFFKDIPEEFKKTAQQKNGEKEEDKPKDKDFTDDFGRIASEAGRVAKSVAGSMGNAFSKLGDMIENAFNDGTSKNKDSFDEEEGDVTEEAYGENDGLNPLVLGSYFGINKLSLGLVYADVEITQGESDQTVITMSRPLTKKEKMYLTTNISYKEGSLEISQNSKKGMNFGFSNMNPITYYVCLPAACENISVSTVSGSLSVLSPLHGEKCKLSTVSGGLKVEQPIEAEKVDISTVSGVIRVENCIKAENLKLGSVSGSVKGTVYTEKFSANTVSGKIDMAFAGPCTGKLDTVSGSINIKLLADTGLDIKSSSMSGSLKLMTNKRVSWDSEENNTVHFGFGSKGSRSAVFGDGGVRIKTSSVSGSVRVYDFDMIE